MHDQLLAQARHLAELDMGRPTYVNLRRAISAAYYAMFHFVIDRALRFFIGTGAVQGSADLRNLMARAFEHSDIKGAARAFASGNPPELIKHALANQPIPSELHQFAATFVEMQERRHQADYDLSSKFNRKNVLTHIQRVEQVIANWEQIDQHHATGVFLLCVLTWNRIQRR